MRDGLLEEGGQGAGADGETAAAGSSSSRCKRAVVVCLGVACAIPTVLTLLAWVALGKVMTLHNTVNASTLTLCAWTIGVSLYLGTVRSCGPSWQDSQRAQTHNGHTLLDMVVAFTVAVAAAAHTGRRVLTGTHYKRDRWLSPAFVPLTVVALFTFLCFKKLNYTATDQEHDLSNVYTYCGDWPLHVEGLLLVWAVLILLVAMWNSSWWLPITYERQLVAERLLIDSRCGGSGCEHATRISHSRTTVLPYRQYVLAGLGTVEAGPSSTPANQKSDSDAPVIVLIHGLGSGSGHFCEQLVELSEHHRLLCVEWRGCGRSDRAKFTPKTHEETLEWFLPALDAWFEAAGLAGKRVTLVGHSMGAIIACEYCWRYPQQVGGLVLASPAGMPDEPPSDHFDGICNPWAVTQMLWARGVTPFTILRLLGPLGRPMVRSVMYWRLSANHPGSHSRDAMVEPIQSYLNEYMYQSLAAPASGERAMTTLLHPDVRGVDPLGPKLVARANLHARLRQAVHLIYGGPEDWMDASHGIPVVAALRAAGVSAEHTVIEEAGHHVMLDNPDEFNAAVLRTAAIVGSTDVEDLPVSPTVSPDAAAKAKW